jgi:hypothetical protein
LRALVAALTVAMITSATAQTTMPKTARLVDINGKAAGTATFSNSKAVVRDVNGKLLGTVVINADGTKAMYDPDGNVIKPNKP